MYLQAICEAYCSDPNPTRDSNALDAVKAAYCAWHITGTDLNFQLYFSATQYQLIWGNFPRGSSVLGYVVLLGLFLAASIPPGVQADWKILTHLLMPWAHEAMAVPICKKWQDPERLCGCQRCCRHDKIGGSSLDFCQAHKLRMASQMPQVALVVSIISLVYPCINSRSLLSICSAWEGELCTSIMCNIVTWTIKSLFFSVVHCKLYK